MQQTTINPIHLDSAQLRNKRRIQPTVLLLLAGLLFAASAGIGKAQRPNGATLPDQLKVMTWNIRGGEFRRVGGDIRAVRCTMNRTPSYLHNIEQEIRRHSDLDVIALQEIYRDQAETLRQRLAGAFGAAPSLYFVATLDCGRNDYGIAIISRYSFREVKKRQLFVPIFCNPSERRMVAAVTIDVPGVSPVHIYNTHLTLCGGSFAQTREALQIRQLVNEDRSGRRNFAFRPVLLGDFNARPGSLPYRTIRTGLFLDAWREANGDAPGFTFDTFDDSDIDPPDGRIDYILVGRGAVFDVRDVRVTSSQTLFEEFGLDNPTEFDDFNKVPDHRPVVARFLFTFLNA